MNGSASLSEMRGIWFGWPITHRLDDWCVTLDWMAELGFNTLLFPVCYEWNALAHLKSLPGMMAKNVVRATYWSPSRGENITFDGPPPLSAAGAFPDLLAEAAERSIEVFPLITSFGHNNLLVAAYPEIRAEATDEPCAVPCTSNPKTHELLFRMYEDVLDQYPDPPRLVHVALDEQWQICQCPTCAAKGVARLYVEHISKIHGFFAKRGIRMMMFDDMLRPSRALGSEDASQYRTTRTPLRVFRRSYLKSYEQVAQILDGIPKDIAMHLWWYSTPVEAEEATEWVAWFVDRGFEICLCPGHNIARAHVLFDATPNVLTMLEYGLNAVRAGSDAGSAGVIAYSPHLFPQEPFYHALAEKMRTGKDDGARSFLEASLGDRADKVTAALAAVTECALSAPVGSGHGPDEVVKSLADANVERRSAILNEAARMAEAADSALTTLQGIEQPSPIVSRLAAGFYLARAVAGSLTMAHTLVEGKSNYMAHLNARDLSSADRELDGVRRALEEGLGHVEAALRALEPVLDWDRHVHRVLCILTAERTFVQDQLRLLDLARQNIDGFLGNRPPWPWPSGWCALP